MTLMEQYGSSIPVTVQQRCSSGSEHAFNTIAPIDLRLIFRKRWPFPGIDRVTNQSGPWNSPGTTRNPVLTDGSSVMETLTEYDEPTSFAYELSGFTNVFGRLVHSVRGEWTMKPDGAGTIVGWTYEFRPLPRRRTLLRVCVAPLWRLYMKSSLAAAIAVVEQSRS